MLGHMMERWMAASSEVPIKGIYDYRGKYDWPTPSCSLSYGVVKEIDKIVTEPWGWYFIPTNKEKWADPKNEEWWKEQYCVVTFDSREDLIQSILSVGKRL